MATKKKAIKKEVLTKEDQIVLKLSNKWEFLGYVLKYKLKSFFLIFVIIILVIVILQLTAFDFSIITKLFSKVTSP